jgi:hypothetical protein
VGTNNTVFLPVTQTPLFPAGCARCRAPEAKEKAVFSAGGQSVDVPVCAGCVGKTRFRERMQRVLLWGGIAGGCITLLVCLLMVDLDRSQSKGLAIGVSLAFITPWLLFTWLAPAPLMLNVERDYLIFQYQDPKYAEEFAQQNRTHVGVPEALRPQK